MAYFDSIDQSYVYTTTSIDDYGSYNGRAEEYTTQYIGRFFPDKLLESFEDISYSFARSDIDTYAFEAYLEFTISDPSVFKEYVSTATTGLICSTFYFDSDYLEYVLHSPDNPSYLCDCILLGDVHQDKDTGEISYWVEFADISKILVNNKEQRIIYVALVVHDGGGSNTSLLGHFFRRFKISPIEYSAYTEHYLDQYAS